MNEALKKAYFLEGDKHQMPFLDLPEGLSREKMRGIFTELKQDGIDCFVTQTHSGEYMGWAFWTDMDIMIDELKKLDMSFFIQDEQSFPSGEANGWVRRRHPELGKRFLDLREIDAFGPLPGASFNVGSWLNPKNMQDILRTALNSPLDGSSNVISEVIGKSMAQQIPENELLAVLVCRKDPEGGLTGECTDVTDQVEDGWLYWDVPEGLWEVIVLFKTFKSTGRMGYINMIDRESVHLMIEALYEPMYERYKQYFGNVFRGFFTDEPEFGNRHGYGSGYNENTGIGHERMPLPWCDELEELYKSRFIDNYIFHLPTLWFDRGADRNAQDRYIYMDLTTRLYEKNFSGQIGQWCREHGCLYTGHVVEDAGCHARLGAGAGHYFRAIHGETLGGVDVVENQLLPGFDHAAYRWTLGTRDGEEFTYLLAKMGSSAARIDPKKKGHVLCETYAAYEKVHGIRHLKWVCDHLVSRGINEMMPNYNRRLAAGFGWEGDKNIQNPGREGLPVLTSYLSRLCSLLTDGEGIAPLAVLYHAEAEWAGDYMNTARPVHQMALHQIDCEVLPADVFAGFSDEPGAWKPSRPEDAYPVHIDEAGLHVNRNTFRALIIPWCKYLAEPVAAFIAKTELPVYFVDALPEGVVGGCGCLPEAYGDYMKRYGKETLSQTHKVVSLAGLAQTLREEGFADIETDTDCPGLRVMRYRHPDLEVYLFFNEYPYTPVHTKVSLPVSSPCVLYNAMENAFYDAEGVESDGRTQIPLHLFPGETIVALAGNTGLSEEQIRKMEDPSGASVLREVGGWTLRTTKAGGDPSAAEPVPLSALKNLGTADGYQVSCNVFRYETTVMLDDIEGEVRLDLGSVYEVASLTVNGQAAGIRICAPYRWDVSGLLHTGINEICADVWGTCRTVDSQCSMFEPLGLLGPVKLLVK